jgi:hypothetical protein
MNRRHVLIVVALAFSVGLFGCGPPWQVLRQATPSPFVNQRKFAVAPVDYTGLRVGDKDEAGYLSEKDAEAQGNWVGDKQGLNSEFATNLMARALEHGITVVPATGPESAPFIIKPRVGWLEPGYYIGISARSSQVKMSVQITAPDGTVLDEIMIEHGTGGSIQNAAVGTRLREDGENLGKRLGEYLQSRVNPEKG